MDIHDYIDYKNLWDDISHVLEDMEDKKLHAEFVYRIGTGQIPLDPSECTYDKKSGIAYFSFGHEYNKSEADPTGDFEVYTLGVRIEDAEYVSLDYEAG